MGLGCVSSDMRARRVQPSETSEVIEALEDSQMALGGMASNRYAAPFRDGVAAWLGRLGVVGEQLEAWLAVQALWMYMEAVFSGGDIVKQLPAEAKRFQNIDKNFMKARAPPPDRPLLPMPGRVCHTRMHVARRSSWCTVRGL